MLGGVHHAALHGAVALDPGHHDPHQPILYPDETYVQDAAQSERATSVPERGRTGGHGHSEDKEQRSTWVTGNSENDLETVGNPLAD